MRRSPLGVFFAAVLLLTAVLPARAQNDDATCSNFDAWEWAQSVFESDPEQFDALDPDGDGIACPDLPPGFAPAFWTDEMPDDVEEAKIIRIIDADTFEVEIDGVSNRLRILRADSPETQNEQHCGGEEATSFATMALSFNDHDDGVIYLERDQSTRDRYGRELAYVWFEVDDAPYMLNHILINNGWAEDIDYGDRMYDDELQDAAAFAERNDLGVWGLCGGFQIPKVPAPTQPPAPRPQPTQPPAPLPLPLPTDPPAPGGGCDPNYTPCIPAYPPDLDCGAIGVSVTVIGGDPHGLDRDNDGWGCESN